MILKILDGVFWLLPPILLMFVSFKIFRISGKEPFIAHTFLSIILISMGISGYLFMTPEFDYPFLKYIFLSITLLGSGALYPTIKIAREILKININFKRIFLFFLPLFSIASILLGYYLYGISSIIPILMETLSKFFVTLPILFMFYIEKKYLYRKNYLILSLYILYFVHIFIRDLLFFYFIVFPLLTIIIYIHFTDKGVERKIKDQFPFPNKGSIRRRAKILKLIFISSVIFSIIALLGNSYISGLVKSMRDSEIRNSEILMTSYTNHFISNFELLIDNLKEDLLNCKFLSVNEFKRIYKDNGEIVNSLMFYKNNGSLSFYFPTLDSKEIEGKITKDIINKVKSDGIYYSSPVKNIYDSYSIIMYVPLLKEGKFLGVISASLDFDRLIKNFIENTSIDDKTVVVISGNDGKIWWASDKNLIHKNLSILDGNKFLFVEKVFNKNMHLKIGVYQDKREIFKHTNIVIINNTIIFLILIVAAIFAAYLFIMGEHRYSEELERELEIRFKEIINYRNSLYLLNEKLKKIIKVIIKIDPKKKLHEILRRFFALSKTVFKDIDAGILFIKRREFLEPVYSFGINYKLIKNLSFPMDTFHLIDLKDIETFRGDIKEFLLTLGAGEKEISLELEELLKDFSEAIILKDSVQDEVVYICFILSKKRGFLNEENLSMANFLLKTANSFIELKYYLALTETNERRQRALVKILTSFSFDKTISDILKDTFGILNDLFKESLVSVGYGMPEEDSVNITVAFKDGVRMFTLPKNVGIMGRSLKTKRLEIVSDVSKDPDYYEILEEVKSKVFIPMFVKDEFLGIAELGFNRKYIFNEKDKPFFEEAGRVIGLSVSNLNLYRRLRESYLETIIALVRTIELKDPYTKGHSERVASLSLLIADKLSLSEERKEKLMYAALLHDIGKIAVKGVILDKNGKLTDEEYEEIKKHPIVGADLIRGISYLKGVSKIVKHHHERWDGKGYPDGLKDGEIPFESRILSVADSFDAMTSNRPYRKAFSIDYAIEEIRRNRGTQFDPQIVDAFLGIKKEEIEEKISSGVYLKLFKVIGEKGGKNKK